MIPLFKTHFSIGGSILSPKRCFELASDLEEVVFVEDSFSGFRKIKRISEELEKPFRFGIRVDTFFAKGEGSKVVLFAKNNDGVRELREIFTQTKIEGGWNIDKSLNESAGENILATVPFYDSYIHRSLHHFGIYELPTDKSCIYFCESNGHPHDIQIQKLIDSLKVKKQEVKTICYETKENFKEFQWYKATCNRKGRAPSFGNPNIEGCGSDEFCYEEYMYRDAERIR